MREICLIQNGDNIKKLSYKFDLVGNYELEKKQFYNYKYIILKDGIEDIQIVRNYNPYILAKNISQDILNSEGYCIVAKNKNNVVFYKPTGIKYSVKPLELLSDIAEKFGISEEEIMSSNNLMTNKLFVGQILII